MDALTRARRQLVAFALLGMIEEDRRWDWIDEGGRDKHGALTWLRSDGTRR